MRRSLFALTLVVVASSTGLALATPIQPLQDRIAKREGDIGVLERRNARDHKRISNIQTAGKKVRAAEVPMKVAKPATATRPPIYVKGEAEAKCRKIIDAEDHLDTTTEPVNPFFGLRDTFQARLDTQRQVVLVATSHTCEELLNSKQRKVLRVPDVSGNDEN